MSDLHTRIKSSRIESGLSQSDLAHKTGVSQPTVANWESGSHIPRQGAMEKISEALGVESIWLLSGEHSAAESPALDYLNAPIRHFPVYAWPKTITELKELKPEGYLPGATHKKALYALISDGTYGPENALMLFDPDFGALEEGQMYLQTSVIGTHLAAFDENLNAAAVSARLSVTIIQH